MCFVSTLSFVKLCVIFMFSKLTIAQQSLKISVASAGPTISPLTTAQSTNKGQVETDNYYLEHLYISFPLTDFRIRFGGKHSRETLKFLLNSSNLNLLSSNTGMNDLHPLTGFFVDDFKMTFDAFIALLYNRRYSTMLPFVMQEGPNAAAPKSHVIDNRVPKNMNSSKSTLRPLSNTDFLNAITFRDTCQPHEKFNTLMQDLLTPYSKRYDEPPGNPYTLLISYENFWYCEVSQIKFRGPDSVTNRVDTINTIRNLDFTSKLSSETSIQNSRQLRKWAFLSGDCIFNEPNLFGQEDDCDFLYTQHEDVTETSGINNNQSEIKRNLRKIAPNQLPWFEFQNIMGTGNAVLALLRHFKWSQVVIINDHKASRDRQMARYVEDYLIKNEVAVNARHEFIFDKNEDNTETDQGKDKKKDVDMDRGAEPHDLEEILDEIPAFIRCIIIIGDIFHGSIQDKAFTKLSKFIENRKIMDNQGTPNKISILVLETEYTFKINSFDHSFYTSDSRENQTKDASSNTGSTTSSPQGNNQINESTPENPIVNRAQQLAVLNSLFIMTYIPYFGVTLDQFSDWYYELIDPEVLYFQHSRSEPTGIKVLRIPSFLFSTLDYITFQSYNETVKISAINRNIPMIITSRLDLSNTSTPFADDETAIYYIFEIRSENLGYFRISSEGRILNSFVVLHYLDEMKSFQTVFYIEQDVDKVVRTTIIEEEDYKVVQNNFTDMISPNFFYKSQGKLICEEKYVKDLDGPAEELSVAFFSVLLCGILGFSIFFFIKKRMSFKQMFLGPHKIIILPSDLDFNNLSIPNFKSKIIEDGSKVDSNAALENENKEIELMSSSGHLKANSGSPQQSAAVLEKNATNPSLNQNSAGGHIDKMVNNSVSSKLNNSVPVLGPHQGYQLARYMGDIVIIRPTPIKGSHIKSKTMRVLRMIRDLRHENINNLVGIYLKPEPPHSLVWEYCNRGSVEDIIKAENIKLDWQFKVSLLTDLAKGMRYIHSSPIRCHGNLKSRNCVIDSRWVLKVTGYGMTYLSEVEDFRIEKSLDDLLWVAPELLRDPILMAKGTQAGDIYSFAIIMQELIVRGPPFNNSNISTEEILRKLQKPPPLIRPNVSKQDAPPQAIQLMKQCWAEGPNMRPDFNQILEQLKTTTQGRKTNIVDTMFKLLEKYSSNLEEIVQERTMQLEEERKKTEALLEKMLPKTVADSLKMGKQVDPENYSEVTIYFSDIVGFTTISAESTPFEVVNFLNDLYTCFDSVIQNYDVYKVETIGDAYMVVSGLPLRNGERHVIEIATLALDLLHNAGKFKIRHRPDIKLKLRIGLHTGPCAAGVVGLTMPRYCLFGDTVNTASRMESNGKALKIHISDTTRDKLEDIGGFNIQYRGEIPVKGKGNMKTYFLLGKDGFDKSLPTLSDEE